METFKQYYNHNINEMGDTTPRSVARDVLERIRSAHDTARRARRGRATGDEVTSQMNVMVQSHKQLNKYSSHELKAKILDKYNELKSLLQDESTTEYTVQHLEDCVQYLTELCNEIISG